MLLESQNHTLQNLRHALWQTYCTLEISHYDHNEKASEHCSYINYIVYLLLGLCRMSICCTTNPQQVASCTTCCGQQMRIVEFGL